MVNIDIEGQVYNTLYVKKKKNWQDYYYFYYYYYFFFFGLSGDHPVMYVLHQHDACTHTCIVGPISLGQRLSTCLPVVSVNSRWLWSNGWLDDESWVGMWGIGEFRTSSRPCGQMRGCKVQLMMRLQVWWWLGSRVRERAFDWTQCFNPSGGPSNLCSKCWQSGIFTCTLCMCVHDVNGFYVEEGQGWSSSLFLDLTSFLFLSNIFFDKGSLTRNVC